MKVHLNSLSGMEAKEQQLPIRTPWTGAHQFAREAKSYLDLRELCKKYKIAGAVVYDDGGGVFDTALRNSGFLSLAAHVSGRFPARVVVEERGCVLLVGTGMGSTGASIVIYELALQIPNPRIIEVGTCVSTWCSSPVGTILVPETAIADDGVADWDVRWRTKGGWKVDDVLRAKEVVAADPQFNKS